MTSLILVSNFINQAYTNNGQIQKIYIQNQSLTRNFGLPLLMIFSGLISFLSIIIIANPRVDQKLLIFLTILFSFYNYIEFYFITKRNLNRVFLNYWLQNLFLTILLIPNILDYEHRISLETALGLSYLIPILFSLKVLIIDLHSGIIGIKNPIKILVNNYHLSLIPPVNLISDFLVKSIITKTVGYGVLGSYQIILSAESLTGNILLNPYYKGLFLGLLKKPDMKMLKHYIRIVVISIIPILSLFIISNLEIIQNKLGAITKFLVLALSIRIFHNLWGGYAQKLIALQKHTTVSSIELTNKILFTILMFVSYSVIKTEDLSGYIISLFSAVLISAIIIISKKNEENYPL